MNSFLHTCKNSNGTLLTPEFLSSSKKEGICFSCENHAIPRCSTEAGIKEFYISGMCEICFDELIGEES